MEFTAELIASFLEGEVVGDKEAKVSALAKIEEAKAGDLVFLSNPKYEHYIYTTGATIAIVNKTFEPQQSLHTTLVKVDDSYGAFAKLLELYVSNKPQKTGISSLAFVSTSASVPEETYLGEFVVVGENVKIGRNVKIYPQVYLGDNVTIGDDVTLYAGVRIYEMCVVGSRVIVHSGAVIGADGFGFAPHEGSFQKIPQIGNVVIEDDVEIGANTCIDRATMGSSRVGKGVKLDNLIQLGHNVVVGENTVMAAQVGVAGSSKIGAQCMFGGQVGIAGHITIADGVQIASQSGIANTVKESGAVLMGSPAFQASKYQRVFVLFKNLPDINNRINQLERRLKQLEEQ